MSLATQTDAGPLSPVHYQELAAAEDRSKKILKAARVAQFNGWSTGIIAGLSAPFALFSPTGLIVTLGLAAVSFNEFRGRRRLLKFEPTAAAFLGWNQLGFLMLIIGYCGWQLYSGLSTPITDQLQSSPEIQSFLSQMGTAEKGVMEDLFRLVIIAIYGTVIVLSLIYQGWNAWYYFSRKKYVQSYLAETPAWVLDFKRQTQ